MVHGAVAFSAALDDHKDDAFLVVAEDAEDFMQCAGMAEGERNAMVTLLLPASEAWPEDVDKPDTWRVPGHLQRSLQVRLCFARTFNEGSPTLTTRKEVSAASISSYKPAAPSSTKGRSGWVVRLLCPWNYHAGGSADWLRTQAHPGAAARAWALSFETKGVNLGDTFKFELRDGHLRHAQLRGLMRVHSAEAAMNLLKASGSLDQAGRRWFVEPVHGDLPLLPQGVLWMDWQQGEHWQDFASRVARLAEHGVVVGRSQLGTRVALSDRRLRDKASTWRVSKTPNGWTGDMVCDVLTSLGFRDCEVAQKCWKGPTTDWLARGVPPSAAELFQPSIKDGAGQLVELVVVKESKRRKTASSSQGLRGETSVSFKSLIDVGKRAEKRHSEAPPDNAGPQDDVVMDSDDAKKFKTDPEAAKAKKKKPWYPEGAKRVANAGRGDCLFLAVADALAVLDPAKKASGRSVRAFLAAWFEKHYDEYNDLWDGIKAGAASKEASSGWTGEFRDYIADIKMSGIFGSYLELAAIAHSCQRDVLVLDEDGKVTSFSHGGKGKAICLFFQRSIQHYEFLSGDVQGELQFWASPHSGARNVGGGSLCLEDFASEASPSLRLSQFASVNGSGAAGSSAKPPAPSPGLDLADFASKATSARAPRLPSAAELRTLRSTRTRATKRSATAPGLSAPPAHPEQDLDGCLEDVEPVPEPQRPKSRSKFAVDGGFRFECHLCPFASEHQSRHRATVAARLHYARVHPDRPNKRLHTPRAERPPLVAEEDASAPLRWTCPYCHKGWRSEDVEGCKNKLLIKWRAEHRDECHPRVSKANSRRALARARMGSSFRKRRRVAMLNLYTAVPARIQQPHDAGFRLFTWPKLRKPQATSHKEANRLQMLRAWRCAACHLVTRDKRVTTTHQCDSDKPLSSRRVGQRLTQLKAAQKWAEAHPDLHGVDLAQLRDTFQAARTVLEADPSLRS